MPITTTPSGGAQGEFSTYTPIYSTTISTATASVIFSNIPTTYTDLVLVLGGSTSASSGPVFYLNGDTGTTYSHTRFYGNGSLLGNDRNSNQDRAYTGTFTTSQGAAIFNFLNYANPNVFKTILSRISLGPDAVWITANQWRSTAPITTINCTANGTTWASGTTLTLYGIKAAAPAPKATGGDVITTDGTYWYHAFKTTGTFAPTYSDLTAEVLMVSGGGGGSNNGGIGAGGGGGALYYSSSNLFSAATTITVGAGGAKAANASSGGFAGTLSQFYNTSVSVDNSSTGGATIGGNGGASKKVISGTTTTYTGGLGTGTEPNRQGGGGAGAGANGSNAGGAGTMTGGAGLNTYSAWATATGTGVSGYYAGGGGGGFEVSGSSSQAAGGAGGGGKGGAGTTAPFYNADDGTANTGGGGGGCGGRSGVIGGTSGNGGSGIVIVRYPV